MSHSDFSQELADHLEERQFSQAFYRLCRGPEDFDGLIAYGIYKDDKRRALLDRPLARNDISFHRIHNHLNDARCTILKENAHRRLKNYVDEVIERATPGIQRDFVKAHITKRERWQFWRGVGASMAASLAMMALLDLAPWFAEQSPSHLVDTLDRRLQRIETAIAPAGDPFDSLNGIEPAAGTKSNLGEGQLLDDECLTDSDTLNDPACRGNP